MALPHSWIALGLISGVSMGCFMLFTKLSGAHLPPVIFATLKNGVGFIVLLPVLFFSTQGNPVAHMTNLPLWPTLFAVLAGASIVAADVSIAAMFGSGAPLGISMMLVELLALILALLAGVLFFSEKLNVINVTGIVLGMISVGLLMYEPGVE